jgi:DNA invertase Pin-like site-specific DNA recombinase
MERELIAERTKGALAYKRKQGQPTSHPPLGFRPNGKRHCMIPVPDEMATVRMILDDWQRGRSYRAIAARLNTEGVPTKQNRRWHHTTVAKVVQRRAFYERALRTS